LSEITQASGAKERYSYNQRGLLEKHIDANGNATAYGYDGDRVNEMSYPTYNDKYVRDVLGRITQSTTASEDDAISQQRIYSYDKAGNAALSQDAEDRDPVSVHDPLSRRVTISAPIGVITMLVYDDRNNLTRITDPQNSTTTFTSDASDHLV